MYRESVCDFSDPCIMCQAIHLSTVTTQVGANDSVAIIAIDEVRETNEYCKIRKKKKKELTFRWTIGGSDSKSTSESGTVFAFQICIFRGESTGC